MKVPKLNPPFVFFPMKQHVTKSRKNPKKKRSIPRSWPDMGELDAVALFLKSKATVTIPLYVKNRPLTTTLKRAI